jgi:hypothetical protein
MADERSDQRSSERVASRQEVDAELVDGPEAQTVEPSAPRGEQQGMSSHPAIEEERQQRKLPPRGRAKDDPSEPHE